MRAVTAKGVAVGMIAAVVTAALILRVPSREVPRFDVAVRAIPLTILTLPQAASHAPAIKRAAPRPSRIQMAIASIDAGVITPREIPPSPSASLRPSDDEPREPALLDSHAMTFVAESRLVEGTAVAPLDVPRRGAVTRALGTTAGAFRTAGTSVAEAFRRVF